MENWRAWYKAVVLVTVGGLLLWAGCGTRLPTSRLAALDGAGRPSGQTVAGVSAGDASAGATAGDAAGATGATGAAGGAGPAAGTATTDQQSTQGTVTAAGGTTSIEEGFPLSRCFRDVHVIAQHITVLPLYYELIGRAFLGLELADSRPF